MLIDDFLENHHPYLAAIGPCSMHLENSSPLVAIVKYGVFLPNRQHQRIFVGVQVVKGGRYFLAVECDQFEGALVYQSVKGRRRGYVDLALEFRDRPEIVGYSGELQGHEGVCRAAQQGTSLSADDDFPVVVADDVGQDYVRSCFDSFRAVTAEQGNQPAPPANEKAT